MEVTAAGILQTAECTSLLKGPLYIKEGTAEGKHLYGQTACAVSETLRRNFVSAQKLT